MYSTHRVERQSRPKNKGWYLCWSCLDCPFPCRIYHVRRLLHGCRQLALTVCCDDTPVDPSTFVTIQPSLTLQLCRRSSNFSPNHLQQCIHLPDSGNNFGDRDQCLHVLAAHCASHGSHLKPTLMLFQPSSGRRFFCFERPVQPSSFRFKRHPVQQVEAFVALMLINIKHLAEDGVFCFEKHPAQQNDLAVLCIGCCG